MLGVVGRFWGASEAMIENDPELFFRHYAAAFSARYGADIESARANRYMWDHAAAPVDVVDIDIVGLAALASRKFGHTSVRIASDTPAITTPAVHTLIRIGLALAGTDGAPRELG